MGSSSQEVSSLIAKAFKLWPKMSPTFGEKDIQEQIVCKSVLIFFERQNWASFKPNFQNQTYAKSIKYQSNKKHMKIWNYTGIQFWVLITS